MLSGSLAFANSAVIFMYHRFGEASYPSTNIKTSQFQQQIEYLVDSGFEFWSLKKIADYQKQGKSFPSRVVGISIDDAYLSVYQIAFPYLRQKNIPFTVFVSTEYIDKHFKNYMSWVQLKELVKQGVNIGSHSSSHAHLIRTSAEKNNWHKQVTEDIQRGQQRIEDELGVRPTLFAYPYGEFSLELAALVEELGLVGFGQQSGAIGKSSDPRFLPRFPISENYSDMSAFIDKANSLAMPLLSIEPKEPVWQKSELPTLKLTVDGDLVDATKIRCFASYLGAINVQSEKGSNELLISGTGPIHQRRFRYNCTVKSGMENRFYWYSQLWIQPKYPEN